MIQTRCAICGSLTDYKILYQKNFSEEDLNTDVFSARRLPDGSHFQMVMCNKDGLVRSNPILEPEKLVKLYKDSKFTYGEEIKNLQTTYIEVLRQVLGEISKDDNILEIGCGNGFVLEKLYEMGYKNVYGIEPGKKAVDKADEKIKKNIAVDILKPNIFKSKKFKLIFFFQTIDHISNPNDFLNRCYKIMDREGYILAFNHNVESFSAKLMGEKSPIIDIEHTYLYSPETIKLLFEKHNLMPVKVYSPADTISVKHLIWLLPLPAFIKKIILLNKWLENINIKLQLGNLCIIAKKYSNEN